jgi:hypothetical protein
MNLFKKITEGLNGTFQKKYESINKKANEILNYNEYKDYLVTGNKLTSEQKLICFTALTGIINILAYKEELKSNPSLNLQDVYDIAHIINKRFLKEELNWSDYYIERVIKDVQELTYKEPNQITNIMNLGSAIAINMYLDNSLAELFGYENISRNESFKILDTVFDMLGFDTSSSPLNRFIDSIAKNIDSTSNTTTEVNEYFSDGMIKEKTIHDSNGIIYQKIIYYKSGSISEDIKYYENGDIKQIINYEYGKIESIKNYDILGNIIQF